MGAETTPRESLLKLLLDEPTGMSLEMLARKLKHPQGMEGVDVLARSLNRSGLVFYRDSHWYHGCYREQFRRKDAKAEKQRTELQRLKRQVQEGYGIKFDTLTRLAAITDPSISDVLRQIQKDLKSVCDARDG